jgi:hypothetical protein
MFPQNLMLASSQKDHPKRRSLLLNNFFFSQIIIRMLFKVSSEKRVDILLISTWQIIHILSCFMTSVGLG